MRLQKFLVNKLHGEKTITVDFPHDIKIVVSENGTGKSTVLRLLVAVLSESPTNVRSVVFESIELYATDVTGQTFAEIISPNDFALITARIDFKNHPRLERSRTRAGAKRFDMLLEIATTLLITDLRKHPLFIQCDSYYAGTTAEFAEELKAITADLQMSDEDKERRLEIKSFIENCFPYNVIYWPTYRRIEEDIEKLNIFSESNSRFSRTRVDQIINFGMQDIEDRILSFTDGIKSSTVSEYQRTSARMLSELAMNQLPTMKVVKAKISRSTDLQLMLSRLSAVIKTDSKDKILELVKTKEIYDQKHKTLAFLLSNLISIYDETKMRDEQIKRFVNVTTKYLHDKYFYYNEIDVTLTLLQKRNKKELSLTHLSSGEKQLISILARLYLSDSNEKEFAILIDEPELSLSIEWQKQLLPDIIGSQKCSFLFAVTHSPFIFENDLEKYVETLNVVYDEQ